MFGYLNAFKARQLGALRLYKAKQKCNSLASAVYSFGQQMTKDVKTIVEQQKTLPADELSKEVKSIAKAINLNVFYGKRVALILDRLGLSEEVSINFFSSLICRSFT